MDIVEYLENKDADVQFLKIDGKNQVFPSNTLCLKKFTRLDDLDIGNIPNINHIVLSENTKLYNLAISNCPNIKSLPENITQVKIHDHCVLEQIFNGTTIYNNLTSLKIINNSTEHFILTSTPVLEIVDVFTCPYIKQLDLGYLEKPIYVSIAGCANIQKITHDNQKQILDIFIESCYIQNLSNILTPEHTNKLHLKREFFGICSYEKRFFFPKYLKVLYLEHVVRLKSLVNIPETVEYINLSYCSIDDMSYLPNSLKKLKCANCRFMPMTLDNLPNSLEKLVMSSCHLGDSICFPRFLKEFSASYCKLKRIYVNNGLEILNVSYNSITNIDNLPDSVKYLTCTDCPIEKINVLPRNLLHFHCGTCYSNRKTNIESCELPSTLTHFTLNGVTVHPVLKRPSNFCTMSNKIDFSNINIGVWNITLYCINVLSWCLDIFSENPLNPLRVLVFGGRFVLNKGLKNIC